VETVATHKDDRLSRGRETMKTRSVLTLTTVMLLLPVQALAAVCLTPSPFPNVLVLETTPAGRPFFSIVGEDLGACTGDVSTSRMPLQGTARMHSDGSVAIGLTVLSSSEGDEKCNPYWYYGVLTPPEYAGTGFVNFLSGIKVPISFIRTSCP
jgi:hypothetical protein